MSGKVFFEANPVLKQKQPCHCIRVYECDQCGFKCSLRWDFKLHMARAHDARWTMFTETDKGAVGIPVYKEPSEIMTMGTLTTSY
jgi:hypothetical protein